MHLKKCFSVRGRTVNCQSNPPAFTYSGLVDENRKVFSSIISMTGQATVHESIAMVPSKGGSHPEKVSKYDDFITNDPANGTP